MQAVIKLQGEAIREAIGEGVAATKEFSASGNTQDKLTRQTEIAKATFERALANSNKISEIITKSNTEAFELLNKRFNEAMSEAKEGFQAKK
jgi:phasin family protein